MRLIIPSDAGRSKVIKAVCWHKILKNLNSSMNLAAFLIQSQRSLPPAFEKNQMLHCQEMTGITHNISEMLTVILSPEVRMSCVQLISNDNHLWTQSNFTLETLPQPNWLISYTAQSILDIYRCTHHQTSLGQTTCQEDDSQPHSMQCHHMNMTSGCDGDSVRSRKLHNLRD